MAKKPQKTYVVWTGHIPGIYHTWNECKTQVDGFSGAKYKSFSSLPEAEAAFGAKSLAKGKKAAAQVVASSDTSTPVKKGLPTLTEVDVANIMVDTKIFTDGACNPNPGPSGSGIAVYRNNSFEALWYGLYNEFGTNNTAELGALYQAMMMAEESVARGESAAIFSDSKYSIQCVTVWAKSWQKRGWTRREGEIKNLELIKSMYSLYQSIKGVVQIYHVNGHVGVLGNELADRMSLVAIEKKQERWCRPAFPYDMDAILAIRP